MRKYLYATMTALAVAAPVIAYADTPAQETLSWRDCIEQARMYQPELISAQESVRQTEADTSISASSAYPQVDASLEASRAYSATTASGKTTRRTANEHSYGVSGSQLLFDGAKNRNEVRAAVNDREAARYSYRFTSSEVRAQLRTAFVELLKAQESVTIAREIFVIRRSNLELITLRYESGMEHRGALLKAGANLAQAEYRIADAQRTLESAQRSLLRRVGRPQSAAVFVKGDFNVTQATDVRPDFDALARAHPQAGKLLAKKNAATFSVRAARADFAPELSIRAQAGKSGSRFLPQDTQASAGLVLSLPLFEGGLRTAQLAKAQSLLRQAGADERSGVEGLSDTLAQSWAALARAIDAVSVQKKFLDAALERSKIAEAQYSLGLIQFDNWTIIEDELVSAKNAYLDARAAALLAEADWIKAKGEVLEDAS